MPGNQSSLYRASCHDGVDTDAARDRRRAVNRGKTGGRLGDLFNGQLNRSGPLHISGGLLVCSRYEGYVFNHFHRASPEDSGWPSSHTSQSRRERKRFKD